MAGDAAAAVVAEKTAVLAVGVVDRTGFEQQEPAVVELALLGEHTAAQILQLPEAGKECIVESLGVAVAAAVAETAPVVHVAVAVAAAAAAAVVVAAAAAIENFVSHHNHNLHTEQIAPVEGAVVTAPALGPVQMATVGCTLAALGADLLLLLQPPPNMPSSRVGCFEEVVGPGAAVVVEGYKEVVAAQRDFYASWIRRK
jgi:hypothetical protein